MKVKKKRFYKLRSQDKALMKSLAEELIRHGRLITTYPKAKFLSSFFDRLVTKVKRAGSKEFNAIRSLKKFISTKAAKELLKIVKEGLADKQGGYTRILKLGRRRSDGALLAQIEITGSKEQK